MRRVLLVCGMLTAARAVQVSFKEAQVSFKEALQQLAEDRGMIMM